MVHSCIPSDIKQAIKISDNPNDLYVVSCIKSVTCNNQDICSLLSNPDVCFVLRFQYSTEQASVTLHI